MSTLSKAERDKLPASAFALPSKRLYPILDQPDLDDAVRLLGKHPEAKPGIIRRAHALKLKLPDAWKTANHSTFALGPAVSFANGTAIRTGKIWEAGEYEDKSYGMTPEEVLEAIADFEPIAITDTHPDPAHQSVFDGKLGRLINVELADDGWSLLGTAEVPAWLNEALPDEIPLSAGWNIETRRLDHVALVTNPRVSDAALTAAYAAFARRHDTPHGQMAIQNIHDAAARGGAVCTAPTANMASRHEASGIQQIHNTAVEHGARCASMSDRGGMSWFSRGKSMSKFTDALKIWRDRGFQGDPPEPEPEQPTPPTQPEPAEPVPAQFNAPPDPRVAQLEQEVARLRAERIQSEAVAFAEALITEHKALPAEREGLIATYAQAATDDAAHGVVTFSGGTAKSRTQLLRETTAARPAHLLTQEMLPAGTDAQALFNRLTTPQAGAEEQPNEARVKALLDHTPLGRAALNGSQHQN